MPKAVTGTPEEREKYMFSIFKDFYSDPANAGKELSVQKANEKHIAKFGSMLRNKKAYQIRASVLAQLGEQTGRTPGKAVEKAARVPVEATDSSDYRAACLIEGSPEQIAWLKDKVLPQLKDAGLASARVDHSTEAYAVLARA